ncbi:metallophosphoesterase family protein [Aquimarina spongiae]|uniref:Icc protein n=1 Tax=Aquimarina spongiae TaxID=570521 RepID=A0A1M6I4F6_9FLAO|nr:metallophosphoesterase [Aquimarina spongiae]SHJ29338.1 Icc protein [Aquimarina spongiae]
MIRIAHITDSHLDESFPFKDSISARKRFDRILKHIEDQNITQIVCTGDIGENDGVPYFFQQLEGKDLSITLGNHDTFLETVKYLNTGARHDTQQIYYSSESMNTKFIYLDSSSGTIDSNQLNWLKQELNTTKSIVIFIHHPIIGLNLMVDSVGKLQNRQEVSNTLTQVPNPITIFCGHYHIESSVSLKNVTQHITPAISYQIKKHQDTIEIDTTSSGYRIIEIMEGQVSSTVNRISNAD